MGSAAAQQALEESVRRQPRPEFSPLGLELDRLLSLPGRLLGRADGVDPETERGALGSFVLLPRAQVSTEYTSNLFRAPDNETDDVITTIAPELRVVSDWDRHALGARLRANIGRYAETVREDFEDWDAAVSGRLDASGNLFLRAVAAYQHGHEERGEIDDPGEGFEPTLVSVIETTVEAEFSRDEGVLVRPRHMLRRLRFENTGTIDNADRERDEHRIGLRLGYETTPGTTFFIDPVASLRRYRRQFDDNGFERDSNGYEILAGVDWDASAATYAEVAAGYFEQHSADSSFGDVGDFIVRGRVLWNATPVVTITGEADRRLRETATPASAGTLDTSVGVSADWEARDNLIVSGGYRFRDERFESAIPATSRQTHRFDFGLQWLINRVLSARLAVRQETRQATDRNDEFDSTSVLLRLEGQL